MNDNQRLGWKQTPSKDLKPGDVISFFYKNQDFIGMVLDRDPIYLYRIYVLRSDSSVIALTVLKYELKLSLSA